MAATSAKPSRSLIPVAALSTRGGTVPGFMFSALGPAMAWNHRPADDLISGLTFRIKRKKPQRVQCDGTVAPVSARIAIHSPVMPRIVVTRNTALR